MALLDHVALVVSHLEPVLARCVAGGLSAGPIEEFPDEGTREVYLGPPGAPARLLLMQPSQSTGPYARALGKRGPGLHHLALHVPHIESFLNGTEGWLVHPRSLETLASGRTAWLARPGVGTLLEIHEAAPTYRGQPVVEQVEVPLTPGLESLLRLQVRGEPVAGLARAATGQSRLCMAGSWFEVTELVRADGKQSLSTDS